MVSKIKRADGKARAQMYAFVVMMYIFVFQNVLQKILPIFKYADELFSGLAVVALVLDVANRRKVERGNKWILICLGVVVFCGLYSSWMYQLQPANIVFSDLLVVVKFFLTVYVGTRMFSRTLENDYTKDFIRRHCIFIICVLAFLTALDYIFDLFPWEERYGMRAIRLFYPHQTYLVAICVFIMSAYATFAQRKMRVFVLIPLCVVMALTLRAKAFGMLAAAIAMYIFSTKLNKKLNVMYIILLAVGIYMLVGEQIEFYYGDADGVTARTILNKTSIEIAKDCFPFGTGFGTFASHYSGVEYSPVYSMYKISNVWGISRDMKEFISDTFWPMILGQFGVIGLVAYIGAVGIMFLNIQKLAKRNKYLYYGAITAFIYLMISSTAESAFVNSMAVPLGWVIGIALSDKNYMPEQRKQSLIKRFKTRKFSKLG